MAVKLKEVGKFKNLYITNAIAYWAKVYETEDDGYGKRQYSMVVFVSEKDKEKLEELGVNKNFGKVNVTKKKKGPSKGELKYPLDKYPDVEGMWGFQLTLKELKADGSKNQKPIVVLDTGKRREDGKKVHVLLKDPIGNGSKVNIQASTYTTKADPDALCLNLRLVEVLELVEYTASKKVVVDEFGINLELEDEPDVANTTFDDLDEPPFEPDADDDEDY